MSVAVSLQYAPQRSLPLEPSCGPLTLYSIAMWSIGLSKIAMSFLRSGYKRHTGSILGFSACSLGHGPWGKPAGMVWAVLGRGPRGEELGSPANSHVSELERRRFSQSSFPMTVAPVYFVTVTLEAIWSRITQLLLESWPLETVSSWKCVVSSYQGVGYIQTTANK